MKTGCLLATVALAALISFAQSGQNSSRSTGRSETIQGCLSRSGSDFFLATAGASPTQYRITGNTAHLGEHIGQVVSITGEVQERSSSSGENAATGSSGASSGMINAGPTAGTVSIESVHPFGSNCNQSGSGFSPINTGPNGDFTGAPTGTNGGQKGGQTPPVSSETSPKNVGSNDNLGPTPGEIDRTPSNTQTNSAGPNTAPANSK